MVASPDFKATALRHYRNAQYLLTGRRWPNADHLAGVAAECAFLVGTVPQLQSLKGRGLGLRWFGFAAEAGLGEESVDEGGPVLDAVEPVLDDRGQPLGCAAGAQVAEAVLHV